MDSPYHVTSYHTSPLEGQTRYQPTFFHCQRFKLFKQSFHANQTKSCRRGQRQKIDYRRVNDGESPLTTK